MLLDRTSVKSYENGFLVYHFARTWCGGLIDLRLLVFMIWLCTSYKGLTSKLTKSSYLGSINLCMFLVSRVLVQGITSKSVTMIET